MTLIPPRTCCCGIRQPTCRPAERRRRARQTATLRTLAHERLVSPQFAAALAAFEQSVEGSPYDDDDAALARTARRKYDQAANVPAAWLYEMTEHSANCFSAWAEARPANDFAAVQAHLEKTLELSRRYAGFFPGHAHPADPHIDRSDFGMSVATIRPIFADLRGFLTQLAHENRRPRAAGFPPSARPLRRSRPAPGIRRHRHTLRL